MFIHTHAYCHFLSRVVHIFIKLYQSTDFHVPDFAFCNQTNWNNTFQPWENTGKSHYMLALILCSSENYYYWPIIKQCIEPDEPLVWSSMAKCYIFEGPLALGPLISTLNTGSKESQDVTAYSHSTWQKPFCSMVFLSRHSERHFRQHRFSHFRQHFYQINSLNGPG